MRIFGSPFRYFQGAGIIAHIGNIIAPLGEHFLLVADRIVIDPIGKKIVNSLHRAHKHCSMIPFGGECCDSEISRILQMVQNNPLSAVVGVGGGKTADTAKVLSLKLALPVVIVPTLASNDAPTSHFAVVYDDNHIYDHLEIMKISPWYVVVDTEILVEAPLRFFIAGIGDAVATRFEADASATSGANNYFEGQVAQAGLAMANLSWEIVRDKALDAIDAVRSGKVNQAFEDVVEATILLSGLGFENGGLAAAHAISSGFTVLEQTRGALHGEMVAFGLLVQFLLEERSQQCINEMLSFYHKIGLPTTLAKLGIEAPTSEILAPAIEAICEPTSTINNMPVEILPEMVEKAILTMNHLGESFQS